MPLRRDGRGASDREQRLRRLLEDVLVGAGLHGGVHLEPRRQRPRPARDPPARSDERRPGDPAHHLLAGLVEAARVNVDVGNGSSRSSSSPASTCLRASSFPKSAGVSPGMTEGGFDAVRAPSRRSTTHSISICAWSGPSDLLHPGKAARTAAGWSRRAPPGTARGRLGRLRARPGDADRPDPRAVLYDDVITFPPLRQDIAVIVAEDVEAAALVDAALEAGAPELREARVFDVYRGDQAGERPQVGRDPPVSATLRSDAFGRGRSRRAGTRRGRPRRSLRRRAPRLTKPVVRYHRRKHT